MLEQRFTLRLNTYWETLRKKSALPTMQSFHVSAIEEIWPYCLRIHVINAGEKLFKYDYMGKSLVELYGTDLTGHMVEERTAQFSGMMIYRKIVEVMQARKPITNDGQFITPKGLMMKYRGCFLPFGDKELVDNIVVALTFRTY